MPQLANNNNNNNNMVSADVDSTSCPLSFPACLILVRRHFCGRKTRRHILGISAVIDYSIGGEGEGRTRHASERAPNGTHFSGNVTAIGGAGGSQVHSSRYLKKANAARDRFLCLVL
jgi:hypothetical protein